MLDLAYLAGEADLPQDGGHVGDAQVLGRHHEVAVEQDHEADPEGRRVGDPLVQRDGEVAGLGPAHRLDGQREPRGRASRRSRSSRAPLRAGAHGRRGVHTAHVAALHRGGAAMPRPASTVGITSRMSTPPQPVSPRLQKVASSRCVRTGEGAGEHRCVAGPGAADLHPGRRHRHQVGGAVRDRTGVELGPVQHLGDQGRPGPPSATVPSSARRRASSARPISSAVPGARSRRRGSGPGG